MTYAVSLENPRALDVSLVGGKAASLASLMSGGLEKGFNVPGGWVVSALAHDAVLKPVMARVRQLEATPSSDYEGLEKIWRRIVNTLLKVPVDKTLMSDLDGFLDQTKGLYAVRSSATCEDSANAAFAGQHETFLNVSGRTNIIACIKKCFASFYAPQAVIYRREVGVKPGDAHMAVVIQKMAPCDKAGVAFSLNPVTGALNETVINANFGLGESVVGGETDIDQFTWDRNTKEIVERHIAAERTIISASGTMRTSSGDEPSLSDYEVTEISELASNVADYMGYPQDIEWGFVGDELVLLQSRPITRLPERLTRDESAERFPNAVTPMTWGLVEAGFHRSLATSFDLMGLPPLDGKWFVEKDNYI